MLLELVDAVGEEGEEEGRLDRIFIFPTIESVSIARRRLSSRMTG